MDDLASRIREAVEGAGGPTKVARDGGISLSSLNNWLAGKRPRPDGLLKLAKVTGRSADWFISGKEADPKMSGAFSRGLEMMVKAKGWDQSTSDEDDELASSQFFETLGRAMRKAEQSTDEPALTIEAVAVPVYSVSAAAGAGDAVLDERPKGSFSVDQSLLREAGVKAKNAIMLTARGDSMFPTIPNGASILVDRGYTALRDELIYVVSIEGDLLVKRIRRLGDGSVELLSDNAPVGGSPRPVANLDSFRVIGRVFYVLRYL